MAKYSCFEEYRKKRYQAYNRKYYSEWYARNKEKRKLYCKKYWDIPKNKERRNQRKRTEKIRQYQRELYKKIGYDKEKRKQYRRTKRRTDIRFVLDATMGSAIWEALKESKKGRKWEKLVGYTVEELMKHLEGQFNCQMSWSNYGSYWWIDHIKPKILFDYISPKDSEFQECWSLNNLRPLEKITNMRKGKNFPYIL